MDVATIGTEGGVSGLSWPCENDPGWQNAHNELAGREAGGKRDGSHCAHNIGTATLPRSGFYTASLDLTPMSAATPSIARLYSFIGGNAGPWRIDRVHCFAGEPMTPASRVCVVAGPMVQLPLGAAWFFRGITSNERYVVREEKVALVSRQEGLGREASTRAALIPIRKNAAWWALAQDERREIFEAQSRHIAIGLKYLPAIARRLHHCRDLGSDEPFDFLTWFEYAPSDSAAFEELLQALRASPEWKYVDREVDIRLTHEEL